MKPKTSMKMKAWKSSDQIIREANIKAANKATEKKIFKGLAISQMALEVAIISLITNLKGTSLKNPKMMLKLDKAEALIKDVQKSELGKLVYLDPEHADMMENEHAVEIYRFFELMGFYPTEKLREFNDGTEAMHKEGSVQNV